MVLANLESCSNIYINIIDTEYKKCRKKREEIPLRHEWRKKFDPEKKNSPPPPVSLIDVP